MLFVTINSLCKDGRWRCTSRECRPDILCPGDTIHRTDISNCNYSCNSIDNCNPNLPLRAGCACPDGLVRHPQVPDNTLLSIYWSIVIISLSSLLLYLVVCVIQLHIFVTARHNELFNAQKCSKVIGAQSVRYSALQSQLRCSGRSIINNSSFLQEFSRAVVYFSSSPSVKTPEMAPMPNNLGMRVCILTLWTKYFNSSSQSSKFSFFLF